MRLNAPKLLDALARLVVRVRLRQLSLDCDAARDGLAVIIQPDINDLKLEAPAQAVVAVLHLSRADLALAVLVLEHFDLDVSRSLDAGPAA